LLFLTKTFSFDAAHHLPCYEGICNRSHGHSFKCELIISGDLDKKSGMICDFAILKSIIEEKVRSKLDHHNINDIIENPTAENIVNWIYEQLKEELAKRNLLIYQIRLWETENNSAILKILKIEYMFM
jgi:6-pyruvoyltetrahydropterin/6-carboxytetrahydropterin synthase